VVDVGCGAAKLLLQLARLNPEVNFLGLDQSEPMLVLGREAVAQQQLGNLELRRDDMTALRTVRDRSVDAVMSTFSLHQLATREEFDRVFTEIARVLKPGGGLYLADFAQLNSLSTIDEFVRMLMRDQAPRLTEDFANSLRAAFPKREYLRVASSVLGEGYSVYTTAPSPFMVVVKNARPRSTVPRQKLIEASRELSGERLKDLKRLVFFFRLGGLGTPLRGV
jgi:SAM-dependent methyltransferase